MAAIRREQQEAEIKECSFRPQINGRSEQMVLEKQRILKVGAALQPGLLCSCCATGPAARPPLGPAQAPLPPPPARLPAHRCAGQRHRRLRAAVQRRQAAAAQAGAPGEPATRGGDLPPRHQHQQHSAAAAAGGAGGGPRGLGGGLGRRGRGREVRAAALWGAAVPRRAAGSHGGGVAGCAWGATSAACRRLQAAEARPQVRGEAGTRQGGTQHARRPRHRRAAPRTHSAVVWKAAHRHRGRTLCAPAAGQPLFRPQTCREPRVNRNPEGAPSSIQAAARAGCLPPARPPSGCSMPATPRAAAAPPPQACPWASTSTASTRSGRRRRSTCAPPASSAPPRRPPPPLSTRSASGWWTG